MRVEHASNTPLFYLIRNAVRIDSDRRSRPCTEGVTQVKVLIIEDNEMNRDMLSRRLLRKGYDVVMAVDGEEGVAMASSEAPDIILMDMDLPKIDGWEATRRIKASDDLKNIPVIALTAHAMTGDLDRAIGAGCDDYDTKPIELPRLLEKIEKLLDSSTPRL